MAKKRQEKGKKSPKQEQSFRVTARQVPTEELLQLFGDAFGTKKAKESDNIKCNDQIPY